MINNIMAGKKEQTYEEKDEDIVDLTQYFDSVDFGFDLTGDWEKDEKRLYGVMFRERLEKDLK